MKLVLSVLVGLCLMFLPAAAQDAKALRGVALVIGQSKYEHITPLPNPANDAREIEKLLEDLGFEVTGATDRDAKKLTRDFERFIEDADGADVALIYYSGHGIEAGGENWLVPVDADPAAIQDGGKGLVALSPVLDELKAAVPVTIFLIDACRSNPFPPGALIKKDGKALEMSGGGLGAPRGFAQVTADTNESLGTVIGFAAEPGRPALDGDVGSNSPYAAAILRHLSALQGQEFGLVMRMVTEEVYLKTKTQQRPWVNESLRTQLFFGAPYDEPKGDDALITGERRKLLLTISSLPDAERKQVESIATAGGVPMDTLYGVLAAVGEKDMPKDPQALDKLLKAQAVKLKAMTAEREALATDDPEITRLVVNADKAIAEGALTTARSFLDQAKGAVEKSRGAIEDVESRAKAKRIANAAVLKKSAETAELDFDEAAAAKDYASAYDWVKDADHVLAAKYKTYEADALQTFGERTGDKAALASAIERYELALQLVPRAEQPKQWAKAKNNLANTLLILGQRGTDAAILEKSVANYQDALAELSREAEPLDWATAENNLGTALQELGERESGTGRLKQARAAYKEALKIRTREAAPEDWAATKNNLGKVLVTLGQRKGGVADLHLAAASFEDALEVLGKETSPVQWARTQNNLGAVYRVMGVRENGTGSLDKSVQAYNAALEIFTRERFPIDWAQSQTNLGNALLSLGERETTEDSIAKAIAAYRLGLEVTTREKSPLDWAVATNNLGTAIQTLGERRQDAKLLEQAGDTFRLALEVRQRESLPLLWAETQLNLGGVLSRLGAMKNDAAILQQAAAALEGAREEYPRDRFPRDWATVTNNLGVTWQSLGMIETGTASLEKALAAYNDILAEFSHDGDPATWAQTQKNIGVAHILLATRRKGQGDFEASIAAFNLALAEFKKSGDTFAVGQIEQALQMAGKMRDLMKQMEGAQ